MNYLDTAPNYGNAETGFAEEKMGPGIRELRDKFFLVTKTEETTYEGTWKLLKQSMKRLQTDRIDLVHLHNFGDEQAVGRPQAGLRRPAARWPRCARRRSRASSGSSAPADMFTRRGSTRPSTAARSTS